MPVSAAAILDALDPEQRAVAEALHGPVCVLAGAGTGKTRAITHRIAHGVLTGVYPARNVLAVTFTARAAGELRTRLRTLGADGVAARTFHSAALRQLQFFWPTAIGGSLPRLEASKAPQIASAASRVGLRPSTADVRDLAAEVEWAKVSQIAPTDYPAAARVAGRTPPAGLDLTAAAQLYATYEEVKNGRGLMDMEDVLLLTVGVLEADADVAEKVRRQYRHLVVDEYQDVSPLQQRLLDLWRGGGDSICVVGDPDQTIYSFAGATPRFLREFGKRHPTAATVRLVRNYRSSPQIVGLANGVLGSRGGTGELRAQSPEGPQPALREYSDDPAEAAGVAARIVGLRESGVPASEIAVLFRTNGQSLAYEEALAERGVPFVLRGGEKFFSRPEIKAALTRLRGAARAGELGTSDGSEDRPGLVEQVRAVLSDAGLVAGEATRAGAAAERAESLAALVRVAQDLVEAEPAADLPRLVAELDTRAADSHVPTVEGVTLASLHAAKGLEWTAVFLVGLTEGMVPISYATTAEAIEEERRLLYVGVTRARRHLELSWALARTPGARGSRSASRFLDGLRSARVAAPPAQRAASAAKERSQRRCRVCRGPLTDAVARKLGRCPDCPSDVDEALLDRLKTWRSERARAASLPTYCVFTDATLLAIAEQVPAQPGELARVPGIGAAKLERYGADVLAICAGRDLPA
ncbi:MAG: UvrD-helicase domain-containing protein [Sporichthyaceae bacterium]